MTTTDTITYLARPRPFGEFRASEDGRIPAEQVALTARGLGVSERTVWRWLAGGRARDDGRAHFEEDEGLRRRLAFWRGLSWQLE